MTHRQPPAVIFSLFGAAGDLSYRLIVPALFALYRHNRLPKQFTLIGIDKQDMSVHALRERLYEGASLNAQAMDKAQWDTFAQQILYLPGDIQDKTLYAQLRDQLGVQEKLWQARAEHLFYLATPPQLFAPIASGLGSAQLNRQRDCSRIVVEKPLGHDLTSFREVNDTITRYFHENQVYRIDHFLGKETVQNIMALRFANPIFEPIWNRSYIDHVAITVAETLGVEHRAGYYEQAGALRDMLQNHLMQLLCLVAMEPPARYDADDIRNRKMDVMHALRPIPDSDVNHYAARGQYADGWIEGQHLPAYQQEEGVASHSQTETYAALKLFIDNWRWQDVPFYLRTGKRMPLSVSEISIRFRPVPHHAFPNSLADSALPVSLILRLQPDESVRWRIYVKEPGTHFHLRPVDMAFSYHDTFRKPTPSAYETLIEEVIAGDASLFMRTDQVEAAWSLLTPVLQSWTENPPINFPNYRAGTWGPESAEILITRDGHSWFTPQTGENHD